MKLNETQKTFLNSIGVTDFEDEAEIEESVAIHLQLHGLEDDGVNEVGLMCESILDLLT